MTTVFCIITILYLVIHVTKQFHAVRKTNQDIVLKELHVSKYSSNNLFKSNNHYYEIYPCADDMCSCTDIEAVCSNHGRQLSFVPVLPKNIKMLYFYSNYLHHLTPSTFYNLTDLELSFLYLGNNSVQDCKENVFNQLEFLQILIINDEQFSVENLKKCLSSVTPFLRELNLISLNFYKFPLSIFSEMANSSLELLVLNNNNIDGIYDQQTFSVFQKLENLSITSCGITDTNLVYSEKMKLLGLNNNNLATFPTFCSKIGKPVFPNLMEAHFDDNFIQVMSSQDIECLINLQIISISGNPIMILENNIFSSLPVLSTFQFDHITYDFLKIERFALNSSSLISLSLRDNTDTIQWLEMYTDMFVYCPKLEMLYLDNSDFSDVIGDDFLSNLFSPLKQLKILVISHTGIGFLPRVISMNMTKLIELHASNNKIAGWSDGFFTPLRSLNEVHLQHNQISTINQESFPNNIIRRLRVLSLAFNPYSCNCELLWFKHMLSNIENKSKVPFYPQGYVCNSPLNLHGQLIIDIKLSDQICIISKLSTIVIISTSLTLLLLIVSGSLVYRYRWYLKFAVYMIRFQRQRCQRKVANMDVNTIDAYISCCEDDLDLVLDDIIPKLENEFGLRLYISQRDGIGNKIDEIISNMDASRKAILIVSNKYACDNYCEFEANLAYNRYLDEKRDLMIIILLEEIEVLNVTKTLHMIIKNCEYISFGWDEESRRLFWLKLTASIDNIHDLRP